MSTDSVKLGAFYKHDGDDDRCIMRLEAASCPELDNNVELIQPDMFAVVPGFANIWRGTWAQFKNTWTEQNVYRQPELSGIALTNKDSV